MYKFSRRENLVLGVTLALFGLLAMDRAVLRSALCARQDLDRAVANKRQELAHDQWLLAESEPIKKRYAFFRTAHNGLSESAKSGSGNTSLLKNIEALARQSGVKINDIKPQSTSGLRDSGASIALSVESPWEPMARFAYALQRSGSGLHIEKATILRSSEDGTSLSGQLVIGKEPLL